MLLASQIRPSKHFKSKRHIFIYPEYKVPLNVFNARIEGCSFLITFFNFFQSHFIINLNKQFKR